MHEFCRRGSKNLGSGQIQMKPRVILLVLESVMILGIVLFEFFHHLHIRSLIPYPAINSLRNDLQKNADQLAKPVVNAVVLSADRPSTASVWESEFELVIRSNLKKTEAVKDACCRRDNAICQAALESFSSAHSTDLTFWLLVDTSCTSGLIQFDQVAFASSWPSKGVPGWEDVGMGTGSGPLSDGAPLTVIRLLVAESMEKSPLRIRWEPTEVMDNHLGTFTKRLSAVTNFVIDTNTVHSVSVGALMDAMSISDPYERSRLLNNEISGWPSTKHLLEFGTYAMPPLKNIAVAIVSDAESRKGVLEVSDWGVVNVVKKSDICQESSSSNTCKVTSKGTDILSSTFVSAVRHWLGLPSESSSKYGIYVSELIRVSLTLRRSYLNSIIESLDKQVNVLTTLSQLRVEPEVSDMMISAVENGVDAVSKSSNISLSTESARRGAELALHALSHESVVGPWSFSFEFLFALYGPVSLPILIPIIGAVVSYIAKKRGDSRREKKKED